MSGQAPEVIHDRITKTSTTYFEPSLSSDSVPPLVYGNKDKKQTSNLHKTQKHLHSVGSRFPKSQRNYHRGYRDTTSLLSFEHTEYSPLDVNDLSTIDLSRTSNSPFQICFMHTCNSHIFHNGANTDLERLKAALKYEPSRICLRTVPSHIETENPTQSVLSTERYVQIRMKSVKYPFISYTPFAAK